MQEVTNELYLHCIRIATEMVEELSIDQVDSLIKAFDEDTKRSILSQKVAKETFERICNAPKEDG